MVKMHKHKGVERSDTGALKNHPVTQKHKILGVRLAHNKTFGYQAKVKAKVKPKVKRTIKITFKKHILCPVDNQGYIHIDLREVKQKGVRLKFERREGRTKRTVGLQIEK